MEKSPRNFRKTIITLSFLTLFLTVFFYPISEKLSAETGIDELREKIEQKNNEIEELDKEIKKSEKNLQIVSQEANTLQSAVNSLDLSRKKLFKDVELTGNKIDSTNLNLERLKIEIEESTKKIDRGLTGLSESLRLINEEGDRSMFEIFLKYNDFSSFWNELENLERFQVSVKQSLDSLKSAKEILEVKHEEEKKRKEDLISLKANLDVQKETVEINKNQKESLLKETKNKESEYQKILEKTLAMKAKFEKELFEFESQLQIAIDPDKIPSAKKGILSWPLNNIRITQYFGKTIDSKRLYASGTHNGMDFGIPMGSQVKASLSGTVSNVGNTDEVRGCYSFGKWILVKHNNGLSTLYAHLSQIIVKPGQAVETGTTIAYSGGQPGTFGAGYSTGPHLHLGLYATEGLRPQIYKSQTPCNGAYLPLADRKAYLDPMSYLPEL